MFCSIHKLVSVHMLVYVLHMVQILYVRLVSLFSLRLSNSVLRFGFGRFISAMLNCWYQCSQLLERVIVSGMTCYMSNGTLNSIHLLIYHIVSFYMKYLFCRDVSFSIKQAFWHCFVSDFCRLLYVLTLIYFVMYAVVL